MTLLLCIELYLYKADVGRHNFAALLIVRACLKELPSVQNVAFFDSSFHMTLEKKRWMYPIDPKIAETKGLRKYGFHGLSYAFITKAVAKFLNKVLSFLSLKKHN